MEVIESNALGGKSRDPSALPLVALVGRPNVGKSTLFNRLVGSRRAIVHDLPGVTRDRLVAEVSWCGRRFRLSDTGGIDPDAREGIPALVREQALAAAREAVLTVLVVDGREGAVAVERALLRELRRLGSDRLLVAVNKIDSTGQEGLTADFLDLGAEEVLPISAEHSRGVGELLDAIVARIPEAPEAEADPGEPAGEISVALVGRPNVGKSTLFNALVGGERSVVSEVAGTTRDTVDVLLERGGVRLRLLDTAGIRRPGRTDRGPEVLSVVMARKTIERADVVVAVLDATQAVSHQDAAVVGLVHEAGRGLVLAATQWDRVEHPNARRVEIQNEISRRLKFAPFAHLVTVSGRTGRGLPTLIQRIRQADQAGRRRVSTGELNRFVEKSLEGMTVDAPGARPARVLYATQTGVRPPTFTFFVNRRVAPHFSTVRYLSNRLREAFGFDGTPLRIIFRPRPDR